VGGGPAPGINGVIGAAATEAIASGLNVLGIFDGYRHLVSGEDARVEALALDSVAHIHLTGGSILRTSRTNPARDEATLERCIASLDRLGVRYLVCIGGDDTTYGATRIAERTRGRIGVVSVPKTIDNDLPLPENVPTFGYETARAVGAGIVENLLEDARTTARWYVCVSMGRTSGALALGMCLGAGANLAVIPEELPAAGRLVRVIDILAGAVVKARARGRRHGVAVVGEGVAEGVPVEELARDASLPTDTYGHVRLADIPIGAILRDGLRARLTDLGVDAEIVSKDIGYELRCAKPLPFDVEYTRKLGFGAVRALLRGDSGVLIALAGGRPAVLELGALLDPATGRLRIRRVDVASESYATARASMERLEPTDLIEPQLAPLAAQTSWSPSAFAASFAGAVIPGYHDTHASGIGVR
jgi:6-phosphofructokinase 1